MFGAGGTNALAFAMGGATGSPNGASSSPFQSPGSMGETGTRLSVGGGTRQRIFENLMPMTLKMVKGLTEKEKEYFFQGCQVHTMLIVAQINSMEKKTTSVEFQFADTTGILKGWWYGISGGSDIYAQKTLDSLAPRKYVRVVARPKKDGDTWALQIAKIDAVTDPDEIPYHMIESCHSMMRAMKANGHVFTGASSNIATLREPAPSTAVGSTAPEPSTAAPPTAAATAPTPAAAFTGDMKTLVISFFKSKGDAGGSKEQLCEYVVAQGGSKDAALKVFDGMVEECELFTGLTDDVFCLDQ